MAARTREDPPEPSQAPPTLEPGSYLLDAVVRLWRGAHQTGNVRLRPWGVTLSAYAALRVIADQPNLTLAQLSRRNFVRPQTMTRIVNQLVKRGWIERHARPQDGRTQALLLTASGLAALNEMTIEVNKINNTIGRVLDADQIDQLGALLRTCARQVEADLNAVIPPDAA